MFRIHRSYNLHTGVKNNAIAVLASMDRVSVIYHSTVVVRWDKEHGTVELSDGGWDTISTRAVINRALDLIPGFQSYSLQRHKNKTWLCQDNKRVKEFTGYEELINPRQA